MLIQPRYENYTDGAGRNYARWKVESLLCAPTDTEVWNTDINGAFSVLKSAGGIGFSAGDTYAARVGANDFGIYTGGTNNAGGTLRFDVSATAVTSAVPVITPAGSAAAPGVAVGGSNIGLVNTGGLLDFSVAGGLQLRLDNSIGTILRSTTSLAWATSGLSSTTDIQLRRSAAKTLTVDTDGANGNLTSLNFRTSALTMNGTAGVASFGPSAVASITVINGIITAIS